MEEKKELICVDGKFFAVKGEKLYQTSSKEEEKELRYKYVRNYFDDNICYIIIKDHFFIWKRDEKKAEELKVNLLCQNKYLTYYVTEGAINYVFAVKDNGEIFVIGRSFVPIVDNLYKIGRYAYQIVNGELEKLCECMEFERIDVRVEISAGENGMSEMQAFTKEGQRWKKVNHWRPGNIVPQNRKSNLKK